MFKKKLHPFPDEVRVAACVIEHNGEILLLQRSPNNSFAGTWEEPGGKIDPGESDEAAMIREIFEETGIIIKPKEAKKLFTRYFHFDNKNISIIFYFIVLENKAKVLISPDEHSGYIWVSPKEALKMNLIEDFDLVLEEIYGL